MTKKDANVVYVSKLPMCDVCDMNVATYDGRTKQGPWAYMCKECYKSIGVGLGIGKGQQLVVKNG